MAESLGLSVAAWAPLAAGKLSGSPGRRAGELTAKEQAVLDTVRAVGTELGASPAQVALAWTRARFPSVLPLVGASRPEQLTDNLGALDLTLPAEAVARLAAATGFELGPLADFTGESEVSPFVFGDAVTSTIGR
jgi:aryl-alcohol dehydrogenase-like predicted oxidoreductase